MLESIDGWSLSVALIDFFTNRGQTLFISTMSFKAFEMIQLCRWSIGLLLAAAPFFVAAQTAIDEDSPWPRVRSTNGNTVTIHLPQVERWSSNSFVARAVVGVKPAGAKNESL